jgi:hypothetical protein
MIKSKELRQGNQFYTGPANRYLCTALSIAQHVMDTRYIDKGLAACPLQPGDFHGYGTVRYEEAEPIPLTPDILEKCGFDKGSRMWSKGNFTLEWGNYSNCLQFPAGEWLIDVHYLHHLQNLFADLTGEELTIKEFV